MQLECKNLTFGYERRTPLFQSISLAVQSGERVGLVGASGCGKSSLAKLLSGHLRAQSGEILLDGQPTPAKGYHPVQMIFQHPERAINPRWRMRAVLEEVGAVDDALMAALGIEQDWLTRFPCELSGGELQRFCVARAINEQTKFLIADEISTMLDVITQAQLWQLILQQAVLYDWGMLVITHNRALAEQVCTRIVLFESLMEGNL